MAKRGGESAAQFSGSSKVLNSKNLKLAARYAKDQETVWRNVAIEQSKLSEKAGKDVRATTSATSLQLTLEDKDIAKLTEEYDTAISDAVAGQMSAANGVAIVINGEFNSSEEFGSSELFVKLWPKLLEGIATEAVAEYDKKVKPLDSEAVLAAMKETETAASSETESVIPTRKKTKRKNPYRITYRTITSLSSPAALSLFVVTILTWARPLRR